MKIIFYAIAIIFLFFTAPVWVPAIGLLGLATLIGGGASIIAAQHPAVATPVVQPPNEFPIWKMTCTSTQGVVYSIRADYPNGRMILEGANFPNGSVSLAMTATTKISYPKTTWNDGSYVDFSNNEISTGRTVNKNCYNVKGSEW
jgi:hypothetical protein